LADRLRIAMFSDSAFPILNGVSVSIDALTTELRNQGHSVHLFTSAYPGHKDPDPNVFRFPAIPTPWTRGYPLAVPPFVGMLHRFRQHRYDVVHTHTPFTLGLVGLRWAQSHELPIVSTYHTLYDRYAHYIPYFPRRYVRYKIAKHTNFYYNRVDHVVTPSEASKRWLVRHSVSTPIQVIPTGVPPRLFLDRSEARRQLGMGPDQRNLLYVGRIAKEKNLEVVLEAAAAVFRACPKARLHLVGDGPHLEDCRLLARSMGIGDRVRFVGFVPRHEVDLYYAAADVFVFASVTETQGLVVQEAMTYGLPAVVVGGGGASAAVENGVNGWVCKNDSKEMAARVLSLINDESLYTGMSEGALKSVRSSSIAGMTHAVVDVYRLVLERKGTPVPDGPLAVS